MTSPGATSTAATYARLVETRGLGASHQFIIGEISPGSRVLDLGCATGYIAEQLAARRCSVVGFERDAWAAAIAEAHCERVIVGDLESPEDRARIPGRYDVVVMGDVLEHLVDPAGALTAARSFVGDGGVALVSLPNIAAWTIRLGLLRGSFDYADTGILDRTHLRFFTRAAAHELVREAGFEIERERFSPIEQEPGLLRRAFPKATDVAVKTVLRYWPELMAQQFVLRLRPRAPA